MTRPSARLQPWRRHRPGRVPHATPHAAGEGVQARANARASNRALRPWRSPTLPVLPIDTGAAALHFPPDRPFPWPIGAHCRSLVAQLEHFEIFFCCRGAQLTVRMTSARTCTERCSGPGQGTIRDFDTATGHIDHGGHDAPGPDGRDRRQGRERAVESARLSGGAQRHVDVWSRKKSRFTCTSSRDGCSRSPRTVWRDAAARKLAAVALVLALYV